jgi:hypothetical protein
MDSTAGVFVSLRVVLPEMLTAAIVDGSCVAVAMAVLSLQGD